MALTHVLQLVPERTSEDVRSMDDLETRRKSLIGEWEAAQIAAPSLKKRAIAVVVATIASVPYSTSILGLLGLSPRAAELAARSGCGCTMLSQARH
jgi:hypothetical protein